MSTFLRHCHPHDETECTSVHIQNPLLVDIAGASLNEPHSRTADVLRQFSDDLLVITVSPSIDLF